MSVRLPESEVRRIIAQYFGGRELAMACDAEAARRLATCERCEDLRYGTTCAHCGCLVGIMTRLAEKKCPRPQARW